MGLDKALNNLFKDVQKMISPKKRSKRKSKGKKRSKRKGSKKRRSRIKCTCGKTCKRKSGKCTCKCKKC